MVYYEDNSYDYTGWTIFFGVVSLAALLIGLAIWAWVQYNRVQTSKALRDPGQGININQRETVEKA